MMGDLGARRIELPRPVISVVAVERRNLQRRDLGAVLHGDSLTGHFEPGAMWRDDVHAHPPRPIVDQQAGRIRLIKRVDGRSVRPRIVDAHQAPYADQILAGQDGLGRLRYRTLKRDDREHACPERAREESWNACSARRMEIIHYATART